MSREFDDRAYAKALQKFIIGMEQIHEERGPQLQENMALLAGFLRLGSAVAMLYDDEAAEKRKDGIRIVFYDCEHTREDAGFQSREVIRPGRVICYEFRLPEGEEAWDEEEQLRLTTLVNLLNAFCRRILMKKLGQYHTTHEFDFGMYNVSFFMGRIGEYNARHMLDKFGACYFT